MDFCINYYVSFLLDHQIPLIAGFFLWHSFVFICISVIMAILVPIVSFLEKFVVSRIKKVSVSSLKEELKQKLPELSVKNCSKKLIYYLLYSLMTAAVVFLWFLVPFSTYLYPVKTDSGAAVFLAVMLIPAAAKAVLNLHDTGNFSECSNKTVILLYSFTALFLSVFSSVILAGSLSFRDIIAGQNTHGILSFFCFPAIISVIIFIFAVSYLYNFLSEENIKFKEFNLVSAFVKYAYLFIICVFAVILFFGGYTPSFISQDSDLYTSSYALYGLALTIEQILIIAVRSLLLFALTVFVSYKLNLPKFRYKLLRYYLPVSIINLFIVFIISFVNGGFYAV